MSEVSPTSQQWDRLMERYQQADGDAAAALVAGLSPQILGFYVKQVGDKSRAEDLLQDFWLRVHKSRHTYRCSEPLLPWIFSIARRVLVDHYRKNKRLRDHELQTEELPQIAGKERPEHSPPPMEDLLRTLPASQRETITLLKVEGLTLEEVAKLTGSTVGAVKQRAFRAYKSLRELFRSET